MMAPCFTLVSATIACVLGGACAGDSPVRVCTDELRVHFTPADTAIQVGRAFTASVQLASCGGAQVLTDAFTWHSADPSVATVDSLTGLVVARTLGATSVAATGQRFGRIGGMHVSVLAEGF